MTTFQLHTTAESKPPTLKRTTRFLLRSLNTVRFQWLNQAARLVRPAARPALTLANNPATRTVIRQLEHKLKLAA